MLGVDTDPYRPDTERHALGAIPIWIQQNYADPVHIRINNNAITKELKLKFCTVSSLQLLSSCLTILVWYSCCIVACVACYRGVVRAYSPLLVSYTIQLNPVNLLQHWGLIAAIYLAVLIVPLF
jgi:hypothetical protein